MAETQNNRDIMPKKFPTTWNKIHDWAILCGTQQISQWLPAVEILYKACLSLRLITNISHCPRIVTKWPFSLKAWEEYRKWKPCRHDLCVIYPTSHELPPLLLKFWQPPRWPIELGNFLCSQSFKSFQAVWTIKPQWLSPAWVEYRQELERILLVTG